LSDHFLPYRLGHTDRGQLRDLLPLLGVVTYEKRTIGLGMRWTGLTVRIVPAGELIHVYYDKTLVRSLAFDPNRRHHPQGRTRKEVVARS